MKLWNTIKRWWTDRNKVAAPVNSEKQRQRRASRQKIEQPTCGIYPHKNRRYDGTLRSSMDATKFGEAGLL